MKRFNSSSYSCITAFWIDGKELNRLADIKNTSCCHWHLLRSSTRLRSLSILSIFAVLIGTFTCPFLASLFIISSVLLAPLRSICVLESKPGQMLLLGFLHIDHACLITLRRSVAASRRVCGGGPILLNFLIRLTSAFDTNFSRFISRHI